MPTETVTPAGVVEPGPADSSEEMLPLTVRLSDGREIDTEYTAERHRAIHLEFLHGASRGWVEVAAGRRDEDGKLDIYTRRWRDYFVTAGGYGDGGGGRPAGPALAHRH